jgi:hypothetical protein
MGTQSFIAGLTSWGHKRWVYFLPIAHLCACFVSMLGLLLPSLNNVAILWSFIMLVDLPMSAVAYVLGFHYAALAAIWILVGGTFWWYFLGCVVEYFKGD